MQNPPPSPPANDLLRYFGLGTGIILIVSSIIGTGVYKKVAPMMLDLHSPSLVLLAWGLAGLVTMLGVLTVAEVAMLLPKSGGPFVYLQKMYGEGTAFYYGWASFACIQSASTASIAYVFAQSVNAIWPLPVLGGEWETWTVLGLFKPLANLGVKVVAAGLIAVLAGVNYRGVRQGGQISNVITVIVLASLVAIIVLGLTVGGGSMSHISQSATVIPQAAYEGTGSFVQVMFLAMLAAFWAYEGWMNVGFVGDEIQNPQRNIPRILIFGMLIITGIYLLVNFTYLYVMPADTLLTGYLKTDAAGQFLTDPATGKFIKNDNFIAAVEVIRSFAGNGGAIAISLLIVITTLGCTNATVLTAARIYYAMAQQGLFFKKAAIIHPKFRTPGNALIMFAIWACVLVFSGTFDQLTDMMVFGQFIFYGLVVGGIFILRKKIMATANMYRTIGYPVVPVLFVLFCIGLLVNTLLEKPREAGMGLALIALGTPFYLWFKRRK